MDILIKKNELIKLEGSGEPERKLFIILKKSINMDLWFMLKPVSD